MNQLEHGIIARPAGALQLSRPHGVAGAPLRPVPVGRLAPSPVAPPAPQAPTATEAWRLVTVSARSAARQMAMDQALAESVWAGIAPPTLRLYRWPVPGLTLGRHQLSAPQPAPVYSSTPLPCPAVRRATGGQAVFHEHEVTFALMVPRGHPLLARGVRAAYRTVAAACAEALGTLGLPITPQAEGPETARDAAPLRSPGRGFACFSSPTREETTLDGCKLVAIAQRRWPQGLLTQGTLPLSGPVRLPGATGSGVAGLARFLPGITWEAAAHALLDSLERHLGAHWVAALPSAPERRRSFHLARGPYLPLAAGGGAASVWAHPGGDGTGIGPKNPLKKPADCPKSGHEAHAPG
ncbi:MAG: hypothetical protein OEW11_05085 [Nitrospirota bacterium]|nr:hypothetical protein [Nitrospirota bacterium]